MGSERASSSSPARADTRRGAPAAQRGVDHHLAGLGVALVRGDLHRTVAQLEDVAVGALDPVPAQQAGSGLEETRPQAFALTSTEDPDQRGGEEDHPAYPGVCIPPPPPDLDCGEIPHRNFVVRAPDPHGFDGNNNGVGCEA